MKFTPGWVALPETAPADSSTLGWAIPAATAAAGIGSALIGSNAASDAAQTQANAANNAAAITQQNYGQTRADLAPYRALGEFSGGALGAALPYLSSPTDLTQAGLEATPGYQFTRDQGLQAVQNSAAARGLGVSGAALKGAANFATGLADNTWQNVFNADQTNKQNSFNRLMGVTGLGENAAAQTGNLGVQSTANQVGALTSGANALAAGGVGSANALSGGLNSLGNSAMSYLMFNKLFGGGGGGASDVMSGLRSNPANNPYSQ